MNGVALKYQKQLRRIKKCVEQSYSYFEKNNRRFNSFRKFFLESSITDSDKTVLATLQRPQLEFNIGEAYLSRQLGEFSKQMPSIEVHAEDGYQINPQQLQVIEDHLRAALHDANADGFEYETYYEALSGGFSNFKVVTDYKNDMSFEQCIKFKKCFDPTMVGHDPLAQLPHKGDGRYCFELYPKTKDEFKKENPDVDLRDLDFTRNIGGFNWSYKNGQEDILLMCHFYEKKIKKVTIVKTADNQVMRKDKYEDFVKNWELQGNIRQAPSIVDERKTEIKTICRYTFISNYVLEYVETDFEELPLVFVDGHSVKVRNSNNGALTQITRPYLYQAHGIQQLKNLAGQSLANELENQVQHKWMVPKEGVPTGYEEAYKNIQQASVLVFNAYKDNDPSIPLPPPQAVPRVPAPPEVTNTFRVTDEVTQTILGSYDPGLGINQQQLSGAAIVEAATQSNSTAMPFVVSYIQALNQAAKIFVNLIPKYYVTPGTIPIIDREGKRNYVEINTQNGVNLNFPPNAIRVKIEAGVNFEVQKYRSLAQITSLMQASPIFSQFMNQEGLGILLDNIDIRGIELIKDKAGEFMGQIKKEREQQMQAQMAAANQPNPAMLSLQMKQQELQQKAMQSQAENQLKAESLTTERLKVMGELQAQQAHDAVQVRKAQAQEFSHLTDLAIKTEDQMHRHGKEALETVHKIHNNTNSVSNGIESVKRSRGRPRKNV